MSDRHAVPFVTPGVVVLMVLGLGALAVLAARLIWGIGAVTNLDDQLELALDRNGLSKEDYLVR